MLPAILKMFYLLMGKQQASDEQPHNLVSKHIDLMYAWLTHFTISRLTSYRTSLLKSLSIHAREHFPAVTFSVFPTSDDSILAIVLVANRYSPSNFWYLPLLATTLALLQLPC